MIMYCLICNKIRISFVKGGSTSSSYCAEVSSLQRDARGRHHRSSDLSTLQQYVHSLCRCSQGKFLFSASETMSNSGQVTKQKVLFQQAEPSISAHHCKDNQLSQFEALLSFCHLAWLKHHKATAQVDLESLLRHVNMNTGLT